jgi:hypothetical protein
MRFRQTTLNILTVTLTVCILAAIAFAASAQAQLSPGDFTPTLSCPTGKLYPGPKNAALDVGFVSDPYQIKTYQQALGAQYPLAFYGSFQAWSKNENPLADFTAAQQSNVIPYITWEPWQPPTAATSGTSQAAPQPQWSNAAIASGTQDAYITMWAQAVKASGRPVYIRYAHEMNSTTYPWSVDPANYVAAWRHIYNIFQSVGATNAKFVFAVNADTYETPTQWCAGWQQYWPGAQYVNAVGMTTIQFGGVKTNDYSVANFARRIQILRRLGKPIDLSETNVVYNLRVSWFQSLAKYLHSAPWIESLIISQAPSRASVIDGVTGNLSWDIRQDPVTLNIVRKIMKDRPIFGRKVVKTHSHKPKKKGSQKK